MSGKVSPSAVGRLFIGLWLAAAGAHAQAQVWTLESATRRAFEVAPELNAARAEIEARQGTYREAGAWPNPTIEASADNRLGQEDGRGRHRSYGTPGAPAAAGAAVGARTQCGHCRH